MHFEEQYGLYRSKEEFGSDNLCPSYPSICNSSSVQATLCLSHSPFQSWGTTTMQGFPSPAMGRRLDETQAVIIFCILLCPAGYQSRAAAWGRRCVSVGLRKAAVLEQPGPPQGSRRPVSAILHYNFYRPSLSRIRSNHFIFLSQISWKAGCYRIGQRSLIPSSPFSKTFYGTAEFGTLELLSVDTEPRPARCRWSPSPPLLLRSR